MTNRHQGFWYASSMFILISLFMLTSTVASLQQQFIDRVNCDCLLSLKCKHWLSAVSSGKYLELPVCGYDKHSLHPLLCCPQDDETWESKINRTRRDVLQGQKNIQLSCTITSQTDASTQVAIKKCNEYSKAVFQSVFQVSVGDGPYQNEKKDTCLKNDDIEPEPREFPHMALIGFVIYDSFLWICGGVLISERYVLSTASCARFTSNESQTTMIQLGEFDSSTTEDVAKPTTYNVSKTIVHPHYDRDLGLNDIVLLKLNKDAVFTIFVRPACLFTKRDTPDSKAFYIAYGVQHDANSDENLYVPKKLEMEILEIEECNIELKETNIENGLLEGYDSDEMICSKDTVHYNKTVCSGDSGGPLQILLKEPYCMYGIYGLISFGKYCTMNKPDYRTRVSHYIPWIVQNVWPDELH